MARQKKTADPLAKTASKALRGEEKPSPADVMEHAAKQRAKYDAERKMKEQALKPGLVEVTRAFSQIEREVLLHACSLACSYYPKGGPHYEVAVNLRSAFERDFAQGASATETAPKEKRSDPNMVRCTITAEFKLEHDGFSDLTLTDAIDQIQEALDSLNAYGSASAVVDVPAQTIRM
jgi:hypothetical protein